MDTYSSGRVARAIGVSVPRLHRAVERLGLNPSTTPGGHLRLSGGDVRAIVRVLGAVPPAAGMSRAAMQVVVALSRSPLGLRSGRAVARRAGLSPTGADRLLGELVAAGLVVKEHRRFVEGGITEGDLWRINWASPDWPAIAPVAGRAVLATRRPHQPPDRFPRRLGHLFWNAEVASIEPARHGDYLAGRLLLAHDAQGLAWAASNLSPASLRAAGRLRNVPGPTRALAENLAAAR